MKFNSLKLKLLLAIALVFLATSCHTAKKVSYSKEKTEVKMPLAGSEFKSDNNYYRVVSQGVSPDISMAEKIAMSNARTKMATQIQTLVKNVTRNYAEQMKDGKSFTNGESFQSLSEDVAKQVIPNITVKESKVLKGDDNIFEYWVCIEVLKKDILNRAGSELSSNKIYKIEENRDAFQKIFDAEINKLN